MEGLIERLLQADAVKPAAGRQITAAPPSERQAGAAAADSSLSGTSAASSPQPPITPARPFYITNPNYDPANPAGEVMIPDPTATGTPQAVQWTSPNGLTTTGVMNPFGLTKNNPSIGFFGAPEATR
jgi:hypothetical protein